MDPVTQGTLGAALPGAVTRKREHIITATWLGCLAGLAPDLDVFIRSGTDPLLFLEYHRQFTHSLVFIPVGALICALVFYPFARKNLSLAQTYFFCLLGYTTHGVLDACTSYGTQLFWPFSDIRIAWNNVAVIDPFFSIPLLVLVVLGAVRKQPRLAQLGLAWGLIYLSFGLIQRERALVFGEAIARADNLDIIHMDAKPGFANLLLWKLVIETTSEYHVSAVRLGWTPKHFPGDSVQKLDIARDLHWLETDSQQARDIERFRWFSAGYLAMDPSKENFVIDIRYSIVPNEITPLWGILLRPDAAPADHVEFIADRGNAQERLSQLWQMLSD